MVNSLQKQLAQQQIELMKRAQELKAPKPDRMRGSRRAIFDLVCQEGICMRSQLYQWLQSEEVSTLRLSIFRMKQQGLICENDMRIISLTELGQFYKEILQSAKLVSPSLPLPPPTQNISREAEKVSEIVRGGGVTSVQSVSKSFPDHFETVSKPFPDRLQSPDQISRKELEFVNGDEITHDRATDTAGTLVDPGKGRRSIGGDKPNIRFVPLQDRERESLFTTIQQWKSQASEGEFRIVSKVVAACLLREVRPWNQKIFASREQAAEFFELSTTEFDASICGLKDKGIAYFYEGAREKKVGLYLKWLDMARSNTGVSS